MDAVSISSYRQLAAASDLSVETVRSVVLGKRTFLQPETIEGMARALRVHVKTIGEWTRQATQQVSTYNPPREASLLSQRQREAVDEVIRLFAATNQNRERGVNAQEEGSGADAGTGPSLDPVTYADEVEEKLRRVQQSDYAPAAHPDIQDPYEGLGEESQD